MYTIIFEDEAILIIDKAPGVRVDHDPEGRGYIPQRLRNSRTYHYHP